MTGVVAVYGALLSTWNAVAKHLENRRTVKVKISFGFETYGARTGPTAIFITAVNNGLRSITLSGAGVRLPDNRNTVHFAPSGTARFPHTLESGNTCFTSIPCRELASAVKGAGFSGRVKLTGFHRDALDKTFTSKRFEFDVDKWAMATD